MSKGSRVEKDTLVRIKTMIEEREFKLGDRITFKAEEFHDIRYGCWVFTSDLASKLPQLKTQGGRREAVLIYMGPLGSRVYFGTSKKTA